MKKIYLIILFVLLLPVTSAFAIVPGGTATGQQVLLPYATGRNRRKGWFVAAYT